MPPWPSAAALHSVGVVAALAVPGALLIGLFTLAHPDVRRGVWEWWRRRGA